MSEATQVGSIVGKLKIDSSDWTRELAAAEEKAHQLGRTNPTIQVNTKGAKESVAELGAVEAAEKKLSASSAALDRMRVQGRAVTIAQTAADKESVKPKLDFTQWTQRATEATKQDTAAKDRNTESTKKAADANGQNAGAMHLVYASLAAIAPAAVPIAAAAVGAAGALGALGAAGILAIKGITDELKNGGPEATQYGEGINTLKEQFAALGHTSAVGVLDGFNRAVSTIDNYMPSLNAQIGSFSQALGNIGANGLAGLLGTFRTLDPVFKAFTGYLGQMSEKFATIGSSRGLQQFGDYALAVMPQVMATIDSLVQGVGALLAALAPLGSVGLTVLKGIGDVLSSIPTGVLTTLIAGALGAYSAFGAWSALIPIIQSFGVMLDMSLGPIGLVVVGVGALIGAMIGASATTTDATAATMGYTAALERDNGIIGDNVRAHTAQEIAKSKAGDAAQKLGLSLELLQKAATGDTVAQERLGNELERLDRISKDASNTTASMGGINVDQMKKNQGLQESIKTVREELSNQSGALQSAIDYQKRFDEAMGSTNASAAAQHSELSKMAGMYGTSVANIQSATDSEKKTEDQLALTTLQMQLQNDAGGLLKMQLDLLSGKSLSFEQAQNGFEKQLQASTQALLTNGTAIQGNSAAAVNNRGSLLGLVQSAEQSAEAYGKMTGKSEDARAKLVESRQAIIDNMVAHGANRDAVTKYVDSIMTIPPVKPTKIELDAAAAQQKLDDLAWRLSLLRDKTVFIDVQQSTSNVDNTGGAGHVGKVKEYATGGRVAYLAGGGLPNFKPVGTDTVPAMLTPDEFVVKRSSAQSIGHGNLEYMNRTGQLPPSGQATAQIPPIYVQNPFTGDYLLAQVDRRVGAGLSAANQDAGRRAAR